MLFVKGEESECHLDKNVLVSKNNVAQIRNTLENKVAQSINYKFPLQL